MSEDLKKVSVSKLDAAKRQLDTAIRLWFADGDPVSIHTLVGAAYQIVHDINKKRGLKDLIFDDEFIKDEYRQKVRDLLRKDFMFFKHADRDADAVTEFVPLGNMMFILAGIQTLRNMGEQTSDVQHVFGLYMALTKPEYINDEMVAALTAVTAKNPVGHAHLVSSLSKQEFLQMSLKATGTLRAEGKLR